MQLRGVLACLALACADAAPFGRKKNAKVEVAASRAVGIERTWGFLVALAGALERRGDGECPSDEGDAA